jgi:hypothetical protein
MGAGIDAQAQAHYNRVIADGGLIPSGLVGVNNFFKTVKGIYGTSDITTAISVGLDAQVLGYKLGAGAGTTAGQAAQKLYSCSGASGDVVQTTAASQPLLLVHSGANYWFGSGVSDNYVSTPNSAANQITGNIEITTEVSFLNLSTTYFICSKIAGPNNYAYEFTRDSNNRLVFSFSTTGSNQIDVQSTVIQPFGVGVKGFLRVTRNSVNGEVTFFSSSDGVTFTQLGAVVTSTIGLIFAGTRTLGVGGSSAGSGAILGKIYRATISNSIGGAPVVDFNPNSYNAATSQTQWTSSTGEVWTINTGTATTGYKGVLVDRTEVQGDAISTFIVSSTIPSQQYYTSFIVGSLYTNPNTAPRFLSGNGDSHLIFKTGASAFEAYNGLQMNFTGESINTLFVWIVDYNSTSSKTWINNANETNGSTGTLTSNRLSLFGGVTGATLSNSLINTIIRPTGIATNTQRTNLFNYLKSINNL